jgi:hypothetical protein
MNIGVANSISKKQAYNSIDSLEFIKNHNYFSLMQIYLNETHIDEYYFKQFYYFYSKYANKISIIYHLTYSIEDFLTNSYQDYIRSIQKYRVQLPPIGWVIHINMSQPKEKYKAKILELSLEGISPLFIEWVFDPAVDVEKSIESFLKLILTHANDLSIRPVIDIPRFYHKDLGFTIHSATQHVNRIISSFNLHGIPIIYHLIDVASMEQKRKHFCALGKGIIPWNTLFPSICQSSEDSIIIFEHEEKSQALESALFLKKFLH